MLLTGKNVSIKCEKNYLYLNTVRISAMKNLKPNTKTSCEEGVKKRILCHVRGRDYQRQNKRMTCDSSLCGGNCQGKNHLCLNNGYLRYMTVVKNTRNK